MGFLFLKPLINFTVLFSNDIDIVMKEMWNERFSSPDYIYGLQPNKEFKECIDSLRTGKLLLLGEGEGRNAVYAAKLGWEVTAVDFSTEAKNKALKLAEKEGVQINYVVSDVLQYEPKTDEFDLIALIYLHMASTAFFPFVKSLRNGLSKEGKLLISGFHKKQIQYSSGGPKNEDWLLSNEDLAKELNEYRVVTNLNIEQVMDQGQGHQGVGSIVVFEALK